MSQLGMKVMLHMLFGDNQTAEVLTEVRGKVIADLSLEDNELRFRFYDGTGLVLFDDGQSCCEERTMHTDDDLPYYVGATLLDVELGESKGENYGGDSKESQFLHVKTSKGVFTMVNYNIHNGYYGGFWVVARPLEVPA